MKYIIDEEKCREKLCYLSGNQRMKAKKIGISAAVVSRLETKEKTFGKLKAHHFIAFADAAGLHPVELLKIKGE